MINQKWSEYKDNVKLHRLNNGKEHEMFLNLPDGKEIDLIIYGCHDNVEWKNIYYVVSNDEIIIQSSFYDVACTSFCSMLDFTIKILGGVLIDDRPSKK